MATLLEKAMELKQARASKGSVREDLDEKLELALAYTEGRITGPQVTAVLGAKSVQSKVGQILIAACRAGKLVRNGSGHDTR
jgi:hypothetical protein